jgi:hypothetical protein
MSNTAVRGSDTTVRVSISGVPQSGTFLRCKSFTVTPRTDLVEDDYLGEAQTELDIQHHGWDVGFSCDEDDASASRFADQLARLEEQHQRPQEVTITAMTVYRDGRTRPVIEVFPEVMLKLGSRGYGGRKERVTNEFEGKCKVRRLISQ